MRRCATLTLPLGVFLGLLVRGFVWAPLHVLGGFVGVLLGLQVNAELGALTLTAVVMAFSAMELVVGLFRKQDFQTTLGIKGRRARTEPVRRPTSRGRHPLVRG